MCVRGVVYPHDEAAVATTMEARDIDIVADLHHGTSEATVLFTDLTHAYVDENMGTS